jgi:hypothetical protein
MIPMFATNSLTEVPAFASWAQGMPQIANATSISNSPWLYSALTQVREIEWEGELIPGLGDLRIAVQTAMRVRKLLSSVEIGGLAAPVVAPVSGGGLSIVWSIGMKEVKLSVEPGGDAVAFKIADDEIVLNGATDITTQTALSEHLTWMLDPRT